MRQWKRVVAVGVMVGLWSVGAGWADMGVGGVAVRAGTPLSARELAEVLGVQAWKVAVDLPAGSERVAISLQVAKKGKAAVDWVGGISGVVRPEFGKEVLVAIVPLEGTLSSAEKVRVTVSGFGVTASQEVENPLKGMGIGGSGVPEDRKDGTADLIGGYTGSTIAMPLTNADVAVRLKIRLSGKE